MKKNSILFSKLNLTESKIYGFGFSEDNFELYFDIDFVKECELEGNSSFVLASSTLVFKNVHDLKIDLAHFNLAIIIDDVIRQNPCPPKNAKYVSGFEYDWTIETINGCISFKSIGLDIFIRNITPYGIKSELTLTERGGISFSKDGELLSLID